MSLELKEQMSEMQEKYDKETMDLKQHMGELEVRCVTIALPWTHPSNQTDQTTQQPRNRPTQPNTPTIPTTLTTTTGTTTPTTSGRPRVPGRGVAPGRR